MGNMCYNPHHQEQGGSLFTYQAKIKLHETDAAGVLFFSNQFKIVHDAYEALLESIGFGFAEIIKSKNFFLPIVHTESDYKSPLFVGDVVEIQVAVENIGKSSFTLAYKLMDCKQKTVGTARTVHVSVDKNSYKKIPLPKDLREKIEELHQKNNH